jgi:hypothetical protein
MLSKQKKTSQRILETSEDVDPANAAVADFLVGMNPQTAAVAMVGIDKPSPGFQPVGGIAIRKEDKKWFSTTRLCGKPAPEIEWDVAVLDALAWKYIAERVTDI